VKFTARILCTLVMTLFLCNSASAQRKKSALLPESEAPKLMEQCSRPPPPEFSETWKPAESDLKEMEAKLSQIKELRINGGAEQIHNPEEYYMQYVGIVAKGRKLIYINAFFVDLENDQWKTEALIFCDGGNSIWGVVYDTKTGKFCELYINGSLAPADFMSDETDNASI
jgi:hypothetical protein